jgi:hypothetical protein
MATKTKKRAQRRTSSGKPRRKAAKPSTNGEKTAGQGDFASEQQPLIPDADERIPELDEACQRVLAAKDQRKSAKADEDEALGEVADLIHKHNLTCYMLNGKKFYIEPGAESVKVVNVKRGE